VVAEDLLADTFERVLRGRRFDPRRGSEKTWLYAIAINLVRDHARRSAVRERAKRELARPTERARGGLELVDTRDEPPAPSTS
jgi:DNA-directed RNA polymerase specialized sigma24 family protein